MIRVGDMVRLKDRCSHFIWYTEKHFKVLNITEFHATVNHTFESYSNVICISYLEKIPRKYKLERILRKWENH